MVGTVAGVVIGLAGVGVAIEAVAGGVEMGATVEVVVVVGVAMDEEIESEVLEEDVEVEEEEDDEVDDGDDVAKIETNAGDSAEGSAFKMDRILNE